MTPRQKRLVENFIRREVRKSLKEENANSELKNELSNQIQEAYETTKYMLEDSSGNSRKQIISIQRHLSEIQGILDQLYTI